MAAPAAAGTSSVKLAVASVQIITPYPAGMSIRHLSFATVYVHTLERFALIPTAGKAQVSYSRFVKLLCQMVCSQTMPNDERHLLYVGTNAQRLWSIKE